jgi:hypothetical protein
LTLCQLAPRVHGDTIEAVRMTLETASSSATTRPRFCTVSFDRSVEAQRRSFPLRRRLSSSWTVRILILLKMLRPAAKGIAKPRKTVVHEMNCRVISVSKDIPSGDEV